MHSSSTQIKSFISCVMGYHKRMGLRVVDAFEELGWQSDAKHSL